jgi:hypothetical protein
MQIIQDEENFNYFAIIIFIVAMIYFRFFKNTNKDENQKIKNKKCENSKKYLERFKEENEEFFMELFE